jgi:hypothetical protein
VTEKPGSKWRVLAHNGTERIELENRGVFDELVVAQWLHVEQMDDNVWWLRVGDARVNVRVERDGSVEVDVERGFYAETKGQTRIG